MTDEYDEACRLQKQIDAMREGISKSLLTCLEVHSPYLSAHSKRVAKSAVAVGTALGLSSNELLELRIAAELHDIGLMTMPHHAGHAELSHENMEERTRKHVAIGYLLISGIPGFEGISKTVLHHHEQYDGTGYPHGLWGERIPLHARIVGLVEYYDYELHPGIAFRSVDPEVARQALARKGNRGQVDPKLVELFLSILNKPSQGQKGGIKEIGLLGTSLKPGMELSRDLRTAENALVLKAGTVLTDKMLDRLLSSEMIEQALSLVYIDVRSIEEQADNKEPVPRLDLLQSRIQAVENSPSEQPEVLVVDDAQAVCHAMRRELGRVGMRVTGVTSGEAALEMIRKHPFDVVVTDLVFRTGMHGIEFLRLLEQEFSGLYCVVLSGHPTPEHVQALKKLNNVVRFVTKPWSHEVLLAALREAADSRLTA